MKRKQVLQARKHRAIHEHRQKLPGLMKLFQQAGLVNENGKPTEEGKQALAGQII